MGFGVGKLQGMNNTHRKNMQKLVDRGYTPQEISDQLQVVLSCILSFYPIMGGKGDHPTIDTSIASNVEAIETARKIVDDAKAEAAAIKEEATEDAKEEVVKEVKPKAKAKEA